jgi:hypothetical protein
MRRLAVAAFAALLWAGSAAPAAAFVVEVTTSIAIEDADDDAQLKKALQGAVDSVLKDAIAFKPTMVVLTHAVVKGGRLYVRLLLADQDGERTVRDLGREPEPESTEVKL